MGLDQALHESSLNGEREAREIAHHEALGGRHVAEGRGPARRNGHRASGEEERDVPFLSDDPARDETLEHAARLDPPLRAPESAIDPG